MPYSDEDIERLISEWETPTVEIKQSPSERIGKTISAFANSFGGIIVLGISPDKKPKGISDTDAASREIRELIEKCRPKPHIYQEFVQYRGLKLIIIKVEPIPYSETPCFFNRKCFIRQGSTDLELYGDELVGFLKNRTLLDFEELRSRIRIDELDKRAVARILASRNTSAEIPEINTEEDMKKLLFGLRAANYNGDFYLKNVAAMFFAKEPERFVPNLEIRVVKYKGKEAMLEELEFDKRISGTVPELIEKAFATLKDLVGMRFITEGLERISAPEYPDKVLREVITNAVGHRDYFDSNYVLAEVYLDRLQVTNPGGLLQGQTILNFYNMPKHRNPLVYQFLHDLKYGEGLGTGVKRVIKYMREANLPDPEFHNLGNSFRVILYGVSSSKTKKPFNQINKRQAEALSFLRANKSFNARDYAKLVGISQPTAIKDLNELIAQGLVRRIGKFRGAYYVLGDQNAEQ